MTGVHRYEDALIWKLRLLEFTQSDLGGLYLQGFQDSLNSQHVEEERQPRGLIRELQRRCLDEADPIYVSAEMTDLVDAAREGFTPEKLLPGDPWTPTGFALFPRAITLDDAPVTAASPVRSPAGLIPVRAISWHAMHSEDLSVGCFWISFYNHVDDDTEISGYSEESRKGIIAPMLLGHTWQWTWGQDPTLPENQPARVEGEDPDQSMLRAREQAAFIQSFWRLGQQFVPVKHRAPRPLRREAKRKRRREEEITVMTLRRASGPHGEEGDGGYLTVQFLVRGHWRKQFYASLGEHRQIWIAPYVKGPEGAPFKQTVRAWELVR